MDEVGRYEDKGKGKSRLIPACESSHSDEDLQICKRMRSGLVIGSDSGGLPLVNSVELLSKGCHSSAAVSASGNMSCSQHHTDSCDVSHESSSSSVGSVSTNVASGDFEARLLRNQKARQRYAAMSSETKSELLSRRRVQREARKYLDKSPGLVDSVLSLPLYSVLESNASASSENLVSGAALDSAMPVTLSSCSSSRGRTHNEGLLHVPIRGLLDRFDRLKKVLDVPWELPAQESCIYCAAKRFYREPPGFCCGGGQITLANVVLNPILMYLFTDPTSEIAKEFRRKGRSYSHGFAFTSIGMKIDSDSWWAKHGVYSLKVHGKVSHFMNPIDGSANTKDLLQLFFLDTVDDLDGTILGAKDLRRDVMDLLVQALAGNPYTKFFKRLTSWDDLQNARIVIKTSPVLDQRNRNVPTADEVAGVWKDGDENSAGSERDIRVYTEPGRGHKVNYYYSCYNPLQYPILFPNGEPGWHPGIPKNTDMRPVSLGKRKASLLSSLPIDPLVVGSAEELLAAEEEGLQRNKRNRGNVSCREYSCYQSQIREGDNSYLLHAGRLGQEFIIDMYIKLETSRLDYYQCDQIQRQLRTESLQGIIDSLTIDGQADPNQVGQRVVLPSSFIGGPRDMKKRYVNAMALVQKYGKPDVFLTMTCNPGWKEIVNNLLPGQKSDDRPDLIARMFKAKLEELKDEIVKKKLFGEVAAYVYTIEYQKRGLPHAHWIIILVSRHKITVPAVYDEIICAELADSSNPFLRDFVVKHMMHGPCGDSNRSNVCMREGKCKNFYPKDFANTTENGQNSYPIYRRRDDGRSVVYQNVRLDNRSVVPYCPYLLVKLDCHINVEICADVKLVKYLYKYIYKGHAKLAYHVVADNPTSQYNEIQEYQDGRYICSPEAYWRIFGFAMSETYPPVIVLPVHLPNHQPLRFGLQQSLELVARNPLSMKTMLTEFFVMNSLDFDAKHLNLLYRDFPEHFVWESVKHKWKLRQKQIVVGRLCTINPLEGERYVERLLLSYVRCPKSFEDLMTIDSIKYDTFREAAVRRGLLQSDDYVDACLAEAVHYQMPYSFRVLFAMLLVYGIIGDPQSLWDKYYCSLSEDFTNNKSFTDVEVLRKTITAIDTVLSSMEKCIRDFPIRFPIDYSMHRDIYSRDYENEMSMKVSREDMLLVHKLNTEQRMVYDSVVSKIDTNEGGVFFVDGPAGTGKTFLYRALLAYVRSSGSIALPVASSGVAASLLPGGRTAHSRFKLPFDVEDKSIGKISKQSSLAKMIIEAKLIIWDEASMANRYSIEALHALLVDFCDGRKFFGGKIVLFGGDFRQTLPIVLRGSREAMIGASFVSSSLWLKITKFRLHENMRAKEDPAFTSFILSVGNGEAPYMFDENIRILSHMLIPFTDTESSLNRLIQNVYPSFDDFITNPLSLVDRAILTPKNDCVAELNDIILDRFPGHVKEYVSFNRANDSMQQAEYEDFFNGVSASGLPPHILKLKKNCPIMLLRNLNPIQGLCNGTRLICKELGDNFIGAEIATGDFRGTYVFIPRIPIESSDKLKCPIPFKRMQFPVRLCFAMTINKAQGQTLEFVGIYLKESVFSHGQLYVGLSRARSGASVRLLIHPDSKTQGHVDYTKNIVYGEVFLLAKGAFYMTTNMVHIKDITNDTNSWAVRVMVEAKTQPRRAANGSRLYQRILFVDETGQKISATIFDPDIYRFKDTFALYKTYTVSNAHVSKIDSKYDKFGHPYQWIINSKTACNPDPEQGISRSLLKTEYASLANLKSLLGQNVLVDVVAIVIQKNDSKSFTKEGKEYILREFAIMNQEKKVVVLTLWNAVAEAEGDLIDNSVDALPIIRATRLTISPFFDGSLGSTTATVIEIDPQIPETQNLKTWRTNNLKYIIETIGAKDHFERIDSCNVFPTDKIFLIADVVPEDKLDRFIVKVHAKVTNYEQKYYYMACQRCLSAVDAECDYHYTCAICGEQTKAKPREIIHLNIYDDTGSLDVTGFGAPAIKIMEMDSQMCIQLLNEGEGVIAKWINQKLADKLFYMSIRRKENKIGKTLQQQYTILSLRLKEEAIDEHATQPQTIEEIGTTEIETQFRHSVVKGLFQGEGSEPKKDEDVDASDSTVHKTN